MVSLEQAGQLERAANLSFQTAAVRLLALSGDFLRWQVLANAVCTPAKNSTLVGGLQKWESTKRGSGVKDEILDVSST
jgi:hypothetical protein